jgi:hypothetical protein
MKRLSVAVLLLILFACKKDTEEIFPKPTGTYAATGKIIFESIKIYTSNSIITDTNFIKAYALRYDISRNYWQGYFFSPTPPYDSFRNGILMTFDADSAVQTRSDYPPKATYNVTYKDGNTVLLTDRKLSYTGGGDAGQLACTNFASRVRKYQPEFTCNNGICTGNQQMPLILHKDYISCPFFHYTFIRTINSAGISQCVSRGIFIFDLFNENIVSQLSPKDTVLIQYSSFRMYKQ